LRIRITTSGKHGRLTVPFDTSLAKLPRNASAEARSSTLVAVEEDSAAALGAAGFSAAVFGTAGVDAAAFDASGLDAAGFGTAGIGTACFVGTETRAAAGGRGAAGTALAGLVCATVFCEDAVLA
jgi:hypothetical protein